MVLGYVINISGIGVIDSSYQLLCAYSAWRCHFRRTAFRNAAPGAARPYRSVTRALLRTADLQVAFTCSSPWPYAFGGRRSGNASDLSAGGDGGASTCYPFRPRGWRSFLSFNESAGGEGGAGGGPSRCSPIGRVARVAVAPSLEDLRWRSA